MRPGINQCELNLLLHRIDAIHENTDSLAEFKHSAATLADNFARVFVKSVVIVDQRIKRDQAFNKKIGELDEEAKLATAGDFWETGKKIAAERRPTGEVPINTSYYGQKK